MITSNEGKEVVLLHVVDLGFAAYCRVSCNILIINGKAYGKNGSVFGVSVNVTVTQ